MYYYTHIGHLSLSLWPALRTVRDKKGAEALRLLPHWLGLYTHSRALCVCVSAAKYWFPDINSLRAHRRLCSARCRFFFLSARNNEGRCSETTPLWHYAGKEFLIVLPVIRLRARCLELRICSALVLKGRERTSAERRKRWREREKLC